jgi:hypothetical protein
MRPRKTRLLLGVALLATLAAAWFAPADDAAGVAGSEAVAAGARRGASAPAVAGAGKSSARSAAAPFVDVLRIRARAVEGDDEAPDALLFSSTQWSPPAPVTAAAPAASAAAPAAAAPQAPPLPFRVLGSYAQAGQTVVFLQQNDQNHVVRAGDTIADTYRVESLDGATMKLRYLPLDQVQTLDLGRTLKEK